MRPPTEKPTDRGMRFFTPDLYVRFNSPDEEEADRADEEWEAAVRAYRDHLNSLWDVMPSHVRKLAEASLHDAELLALQEDVEPFYPVPFDFPVPVPFWSAIAVLALKQGDRVVNLFYFLRDRVRRLPAEEGWKFSKERAHWLYDELDVSSQRPPFFLHRILLSDGRVIEIPFWGVVILTYSLTPAPREQASHPAT